MSNRLEPAQLRLSTFGIAQAFRNHTKLSPSGFLRASALGKPCAITARRSGRFHAMPKWDVAPGIRSGSLWKRLLSTRTRKAYAALVLISCALSAALLRNALRVRQLESGSAHIGIGDSRNAVVAQLGQPWKKTHCGEFLGGSPPGCHDEYVYANPYAPLLPEYWTVSFNADGRVVNVVRLASP